MVWIIAILIVGAFAYIGWKKYGEQTVEEDDNDELSLAMSVLPPVDLTLEPAKAEQWRQKDRLEQAELELKKIGAEHAGYYYFYRGCAINRISIWSYKQQVMIVLHEIISDADLKNPVFNVELICQLESGVLVVSSIQYVKYENRPKEHIVVFKLSKSILDLLKSLKSEIPQGKKLQKIINVESYFSQYIETLSEFAWRPSHLRNEKTKQLLTTVNVSFTDELILDLIDTGISHTVDINIKHAKEKMLKHSKMPEEQWEKIKNRLVIVNELMDADLLVAAVYDLSKNFSEEQESIIESFQENNKKIKDPLLEFQRLLDTLKISAKRITKMDSPVKTEVYLAS